ncbi:MAG: hypothetical protein VW405_02370 [Rhodospirillaceae bacterium]
MANEFLAANNYTAMQTMARRLIEGLDTSVSVSITYRQQTAETYTPATGTSAPTVTNTAVTALRLVKHSDDAAQAGEAGRVTWLIEKRRLDTASVTEPSTADRIVDADSQVYEVTSWSLDAGRLYWIIHSDRVGT